MELRRLGRDPALSGGATPAGRVRAARPERADPRGALGYPRPVAGKRVDLPIAPRGRHGLPADIVSAHQRQRLLAATTELVAERGYHGASIDQILKAARVGYVAFYELFPGKEECFIAAFEEIVAEAREEILDAVAADDPWPAQLCTALRTLLARIAAEPSDARLVLGEVHAAGPAALGRYEELLEEAAAALRAGRAYGKDPGRAAVSLEEANVGGVVWLLHQRLVGGRLEGVEDLFGELASVLLEPYVGAAKARKLISAAVPAEI
jgi:AcrR family transcriptional regulator